MFETEPEIRELQTLIDQSLARSTAYLRSIITPGERSVSVDQMTVYASEPQRLECT